MSFYRRVHFVEIEEPPIPSLLSLIESTTPKSLIDLDLDIFNPIPSPSPFHLLTQINRTSTYTYLPPPPPPKLSGSDLYHLATLSDRLSALESTVQKLVKPKPKPTKTKSKTTVNYTWTAEINNDDGVERKYQLTAKIKGCEVDDKKVAVAVAAAAEKVKKSKEIDVKNYKWSSEIKGRGEHSPVHKYSFEVSTGKPKEKKEKKEKKKNKKEDHHRTVEIEEISDNPGALVLQQVFARRAGALNAKGKKKELSPQDAVILIQSSFRAYLIRRSKALRGLRELAVAKNKLKELRKLFNNFSYRRRIAQDAEECQKFTERIIVVLLTVDAIEGVDVMIRAAKRSMVDELEAMLDVVDPQPSGHRSLSIKRRTFDLPTGGIQKEIAAGVAQVVKMLNEEENGTEDSTFEACL